MLPFAETAIIPAHQYLHLFPAAAMRAENIEIRIAGQTVERRFPLFLVADGVPSPEVKRNRSRHRKAAANGRVDCRIKCCGPAAAGEARHVKLAVSWQAAAATVRLDVIQTGRGRFEEIFHRAARGLRLKELVVTAAAISG